jgi:hypothetical protein
MGRGMYGWTDGGIMTKLMNKGVFEPLNEGIIID